MIAGPVLFGAAPGGTARGAAASVLAAIGAEVHTPMTDELRSAAADAGVDAKLFNPDTAADEDASRRWCSTPAASSTEELREAWVFFHPTMRRVRRSGRVIVLATPPEEAGPPEAQSPSEPWRG